MLKLSDEQLIEIVNDPRNGYRDDAVIAAESILMSRKAAIEQCRRQPETSDEIHQNIDEGDIDMSNIIGEPEIDEEETPKKKKNFYIYGWVIIILGIYWINKGLSYDGFIHWWYVITGLSSVFAALLIFAVNYMKNPPNSSTE